MKKILTAGFLGLVIVLGFGPSARASYTDRRVEDSGDSQTYKHPSQRSFTSPFDYAPVTTPRVAPAPEPQGRCNCYTFDASKSYDLDKQKLSILWDFGDGETSDKPVVNHCYKKAGDYSVSLKVKDDSGMPCDTGMAATKVSANFPPTAAAGADQKVCLGEAVSLDASSSTASGPAAYKWEFGDGESGEGVRASHSYAKPGQYHVRLTVDDGKKTECSIAVSGLTVTVADRPSVHLEGPAAVCVGRSASFNANGTGGSLKYHWDFGDGETMDGGSQVSHAYNKGGNYTVSVTADNGQGFSCSVVSDSHGIKVSSPPIANAGQNLACCVGKVVAFDASKSSSPDGSALSYHWTFGDGATSDEKSTTHTYEKPGSYRVVLTVKSDSGSECSMASDSFVATVNTQPEAVIEVR